MFGSVFNRHLEPSLLRRLRLRYLATSLTKRRAIRQSISLMLASVLGIGVFTAVDRSAETREQWGETTKVLVAARTLESGAQLAASDVKPVPVPRALLPENALIPSTVGGTSLELPERRVRTRIEAGEILTTSDMVDGRRGAVAALVGADRVAVTVRLPKERPPIEVDDSVDVYGPDTNGDPMSESFPYTAPPAAERTIQRLAAAALVLKLGPDAATLLVAEDEVVPILSAAASSGVSLVITG